MSRPTNGAAGIYFSYHLMPWVGFEPTKVVLHPQQWTFTQDALSIELPLPRQSQKSYAKAEFLESEMIWWHRREYQPRPMATTTTTTSSTIRPSQTTSSLADWQPLFVGSEEHGFGAWLGGVNNRFPVSYADVQPQFVIPIEIEGRSDTWTHLENSKAVWSDWVRKRVNNIE